MDKQLIRARFARSLGSYEDHAFAQKDIAVRMCRMLCEQVKDGQVGDVLEVGCGSGVLTRMFLKAFRPASMTLNDICPEAGALCAEIAAGELGRGVPLRFITGDAESVALPNALGLILSSSVIQWFESPGEFVRKCAGLLLPGGLLAFSTFGPENLREIRTLTGQGLKYLPLEEVVSLVKEAGLELLSSGSELMSAVFPSVRALLQHLKSTGVTGVSRASWTRGQLEDFSSAYMKAYGTESGEVSLTYHPIYIIAGKRS